MLTTGGSLKVTLKPNGDLNSHLEWVQEQISQPSNAAHCEIIYKYDVLRGYEAKLNKYVLTDLRKRSDVKSIVQDHEGTLDDILDT
ncbi:unnamed protein product [Rhizoctonia solani]|uniref:Inhibitor I9 domain-containing protein n=1 Tax=Rhizoctonia solani TaxID=456999 RepID=A0A8H2Y2L8_9AGAM|nr:unnamed protein product [Rhizoctonia solani]